MISKKIKAFKAFFFAKEFEAENAWITKFNVFFPYFPNKFVKIKPTEILSNWYRENVHKLLL